MKGLLVKDVLLIKNQYKTLPLLLACGLLLIVFGLVRRRGKKNEA